MIEHSHPIPRVVVANDNVSLSPVATRPSPVPLKAVRTPRKARSFPYALLALSVIVGLTAIWWLNLSFAGLTPIFALITAVMLAASIFAKQARAARGAELSALATILAGTITVGLEAAAAGLSLGIAEFCLIAAIGAMILFTLTRAHMALLTASFALAVWLFALQPAGAEVLGVVPLNAAWTPAVPLVLSALILAANAVRSSRSLVLAIGLAYAWAAHLLIQTGLSLPIMAGLAFIAAVAHHRLGKAWADEGGFRSGFHLMVGWTVAVAMATYVQTLWLSPLNADALLAAGGTATLAWKSIFWIAALGIFISSIQRYKTAQITLPGIFLVSAVSAILPLATLQPTLIFEAFAKVPGFPPLPGFALVIGAGICASAVAMTVNGLRRMNPWHITAGVAVMGWQVLLLLGRVDFGTIDLTLIFIVSLIAALAVSGLIAGASLNHQAPARRGGYALRR